MSDRLPRTNLIGEPTEALCGWCGLLITWHSGEYGAGYKPRLGFGIWKHGALFTVQWANHPAKPESDFEQQPFKPGETVEVLPSATVTGVRYTDPPEYEVEFPRGLRGWFYAEALRRIDPTT